MNKKFDAYRYINDYKKQHYDRFTLLLPKGEKDRLKKIAECKGKSLSAFILDVLKLAEKEGLF